MKIGMNLLLYTTAPDASTFPIAERLKGMGFDGLEWPILETDRQTAESIRAFNEKAKLEATTVFVFGPDDNPISADDSARAHALATLRERIDVCRVLGSRLLCGPFVQPLGEFSGAAPTAEEWSRCVDFLKAAGDYAAERDVTLVVEYLNRFEIYLVNTAADAVRLCEQVGHPNVKMMVDSFHAHIEEKSLYQALVTAKGQLAHIHVSENDRGVPGSGTNLRWDDFFRGIRAIGYDGWLTIESFGRALPDLAAAAKIWRTLFDNPDDVGRDGIAFVKRMLGQCV